MSDAFIDGSSSGPGHPAEIRPPPPRATISLGSTAKNLQLQLTTILITMKMRSVLVCILDSLHMTPQTKPANTPPPAAIRMLRPRIDSEQLLQGASAIEIAHGGQIYLLRVTRENKLILTK